MFEQQANVSIGDGVEAMLATFRDYSSTLRVGYNTQEKRVG
ncbi:hypothetical protein [Xylella taiwanensis]|nr:hypothetical protein [Xylella taiwanensis]